MFLISNIMYDPYGSFLVVSIVAAVWFRRCCPIYRASSVSTTSLMSNLEFVGKPCTLSIFQSVIPENHGTGNSTWDEILRTGHWWGHWPRRGRTSRHFDWITGHGCCLEVWILCTLKVQGVRFRWKDPLAEIEYKIILVRILCFHKCVSSKLYESWFYLP